MRLSVLDITMLYVLVVLLSVLATPLVARPGPEAKGRSWVLVIAGMVLPEQTDRYFIPFSLVRKKNKNGVLLF